MSDMAPVDDGINSNNNRYVEQGVRYLANREMVSIVCHDDSKPDSKDDSENDPNGNSRPITPADVKIQPEQSNANINAKTNKDSNTVVKSKSIRFSLDLDNNDTDENDNVTPNTKEVSPSAKRLVRTRSVTFASDSSEDDTNTSTKTNTSAKLSSPSKRHTPTRSVKFFGESFDSSEDDDLNTSRSARLTPLPLPPISADTSGCNSLNSSVESSPRSSARGGAGAYKGRLRSMSLDTLTHTQSLYQNHGDDSPTIASPRTMLAKRQSYHSLDVGSDVNLSIIPEGEVYNEKSSPAPSSHRRRASTIDSADRREMKIAQRNMLETIRAKRDARRNTRQLQVGVESKPSRSSSLTPYFEVDLGQYQPDPERLDFIRKALSPNPCPISPTVIKQRSLEAAEKTENNVSLPQCSNAGMISKNNPANQGTPEYTAAKRLSIPSESSLMREASNLTRRQSSSSLNTSQLRKQVTIDTNQNEYVDIDPEQALIGLQ